MNNSHLSSSNKYIDIAIDKLKLADDLATLIKTPDREIHVELPLVLDNGSLHNFVGYRVQHNNSRGPCKGGVAFYPSVTIEDTRAVAELMTYKSALHNLPFGGAHGAVRCNTKKLSKLEQERLTKLYTAKIDCFLGPNLDIPGPDLYTDSQTMSWILDEYSKRHEFKPACVTGKPLELFGSHLRGKGAALGIVSLLMEHCKRKDKDFAELTFAVNGFGEVGYNTASLISSFGGKVVSIADSSGAIWQEEGLNIEWLKSHKDSSGSINDFANSSAIDKDEQCFLDVDVLVLASLSEHINLQNVEKVKAGLIVEASNIAISFEANQILEDAGKDILPDILVNAGGLIVSYFEWIQNIQQFKWQESAIEEELFKILLNSYEQAVQVSESENCSLRIASYMIAARGLAACTQLRGYQ